MHLAQPRYFYLLKVATLLASEAGEPPADGMEVVMAPEAKRESPRIRCLLRFASAVQNLVMCVAWR